MENAIVAAQASVLMEKVGAWPPETLAVVDGSKPAGMVSISRAEVDTSSPFVSVKDAVDRFGGSALWASQLKRFFNSEKHHSVEDDFQLRDVQKETAELEKELIKKEQETWEILKHLESTKTNVDSLKMRLYEELFVVNGFPEALSEDLKLHPATRIESEGEILGVNSAHAESPRSILVGLGQAKMNLSRKTHDLADILASIDSINHKLKEEKASIEKTRGKLFLKRKTVSSLENDLKQMTSKLQLTKDAKDKCNEVEVPESVPEAIKALIFEREHFKKTAETEKSEVLRLTYELEHIKISIKAAEIRCSAAKKMEEAAKAIEAAALAQCKVLINSSNSASDVECHSSVVLPIVEYSILTHKIHEAEEKTRKRIECAMLEVYKASQSKQQVETKIEEAAEAAESVKKLLKVAINRAEAANRGKLAVEEALRKRRSEQGLKRCCSLQNSPKFKNIYPCYQRQVSSRMLDLNGLNLVNDDDLMDGLRHNTLSIGEILSRKLVGPGDDDDYDTANHKSSDERAKVSLGQILNRRPEVLSPRYGCGYARKQHRTKRKRFGIVLFSRLSRNEILKRKNRKQNSGSG